MNFNYIINNFVVQIKIIKNSKVLHKMVELNVYKVRFYIFAEVEDAPYMGKVNYYFNYYIH